MYTCCPICKTNFSITEAQLQVAQGKVRCGSCKNVFNARQHIHYHDTKVTPTPPAKKPLSEPQKQASNKPKTRPPASTRSKDLFLKKESLEKKITATKLKIQQKITDTPEPTSEIDAIFNALDSQLTSGTYIDIASSEKTDIREAEFNDIFDDDEFNDVDNTFLAKNQKNISANNVEDKVDNNPDLDLYVKQEQDDIAAASETEKIEITPPANKAPIQQTSIDTTFQETPTEKKQQHAFDFVNLPDEPHLTSEAKKQLAAVNTPLKMSPTNKLVTKTENDALHQAIDNIIKVDNTITTPFEENDADHFVIEMHSEPDVELVDEHDIDRLFASTDSLKISDLKFGTSKAISANTDTDLSEDEAFQPIFSDRINTDVNETINEDQSDAALSYDLDSDLNFDNDLDDEREKIADEKIDEAFASDELNEADDEAVDNDNLSEPMPDEDPAQEDYPSFENQFDDADIDEEIILSSPDEEPIPHRLRDAVAHLEQPSISVKQRIFYFSGVVIFVLLAGLQLIIFKSTAIANTLPVFQSALASACQTLPCRYTGNHNRKQIKIISRDIRLHPKIKAALLISATIVNKAAYTQPYPTILLKFTDLTGATVAQRYFQPTEYLGLLNKPFALMPSKKPIQLSLEILDPGSDAINFQFFFL